MYNLRNLVIIMAPLLMHAVLFLSKGFYRFVEGLVPALDRVIYRILMVRIEGIKKIQKVLKFKLLEYLIDSTKINMSRVYIFYILILLKYIFLCFFGTATLYLPWPINYSKLIKFSRRKGKRTRKKNFTLLMKLLTLKYLFNLSTSYHKTISVHQTFQSII